MERTGNLEAIENERASLQERMAEIEGLDKELQSRLAKAERELIGERERAESAASSLEDLSERLSEVLEQREQERGQHERERGELKEEITALHSSWIPRSRTWRRRMNRLDLSTMMRRPKQRKRMSRSQR